MDLSRLRAGKELRARTIHKTNQAASVLDTLLLGAITGGHFI
jgi:hypothetical protein